MLRRCLVAVTLVAVVGFPWPVSADRWLAPSVTTVSSSSGRYFVRVIPGGVYGDEGNARAEFYEQRVLNHRMTATVRLVNRVAPVDALLSNAGYLMTFDNWHGAGYGPVVAIYGPTGSLISAYRLEQLYRQTQLEQLPRSVSSRWWRCRPWGWIDAAQAAVRVTDSIGGTFVFQLATGAFEYRAGTHTCPWRRSDGSAHDAREDRGDEAVDAGLVDPADDRDEVVLGVDPDHVAARARYLLRPPLALERLTESSRGQLVFELPHPRADGATHLLLDPLELIEKLTLLIPPLRVHILRVHGVLGPVAGWRAAGIPGRPEAVEDGPPAAGPRAGPSPGAWGAPRESASMWAALLRRVFALDVCAWPRCGGRRRVVGVHPGGESLQALLERLGFVSASPAVEPSRASPRGQA